MSPIGPIDSSTTPRYAGFSTFARLPRLDQVPHADIAVVGVPFDTGVSYRPGTRFGPAHVREASRLLRPYNPGLDIAPFDVAQVAPAYDHAELTCVAASHIAYDLVSLMAARSPEEA